MTEKLNILFVDDEKQILIPLKAMFKKQYGVFTAVSGPLALEIINKNWSKKSHLTPCVFC